MSDFHDDVKDPLLSGYPVDLVVGGMRVLVVGLGNVGSRKARGLLAAGAIVVGVDPRTGLTPPAGVEHHAEAFHPGHLDGVRLAFAAATPEVNIQVVAEARTRGIWVNAASDPGAGDFTVPAVWRAGRITLAVSTSGHAPTLARVLRDRAARAIAPAAPLVELFAKLRVRAIEQIPDPQARRKLFSRWADESWLEVLEKEGPVAVESAWLDLLGQVVRLDSSLYEEPGMS